MESEFVSHLCNRHRVWQVLFVGKDQQSGVTELIFSEKLLEFIGDFVDTRSVIRINDEDNSLGVVVVMSPESANFVLTSDIPDSEVDVLVFHGLDVEANRGDCCHYFSQLGKGQTKVSILARLTKNKKPTSPWLGSKSGTLTGTYSPKEKRVTYLEFVQDSSLSCSIQSNHQDPHVLFEATEQIEEVSHCVVLRRCGLLFAESSC